MDRTWESPKNLTRCPRLVKKFHQENPSRPKEVSRSST
jgi:hypothetical protein